MQVLRILATLLGLALASVANAKDWQALAERQDIKLPNPSGHTATGYGVSLVLAAVAPEHQEALIARGKDYGHSRVVCRVHYPSDIEAGMQVADAVFARQMETEQFRVDLEAARNEWKALQD